MNSISSFPVHLQTHAHTQSTHNQVDTHTRSHETDTFIYVPGADINHVRGLVVV